MAVTFPFKEGNSRIFGKFYRPVAIVLVKHKKAEIWRHIEMVVDTGADYTILPKYLASELGVSLTKDCKQISTQGVGGKIWVYLLKDKIEVKIGEMERIIPIGFASSDKIPALLGRQGFFESFKVTFEKFVTTFE